MINLFTSLVEIDSPSYAEREMCDRLTCELKALGFDVFEDDAGAAIGGNAGNLYAYLCGDESLEPLLFCAHMDTVEPSRGKAAVVDGDVITSRGDTVLGADDLAGIVSILTAVRRVRDGRHRPIEVLFTVAEEVYGRGAKIFDYSKIKSKMAIVPDLSGVVGGAASRAPTIIQFSATVRGKAAHAGFAFGEGIHAIAAAAQAVTKMPMGQVDADTTCNLGVINGGLAGNIVPDLCRVSGEIRSYDHGKALAQLREVERIFMQSAERYSAALEFESEVMIEAYECDKDVADLFEKVCVNLKIPVKLHPTFGGSDNNHIVKHGIKGLVIASAMNNCHSTKEYTEVREMERLTDILTELML
ncbi:hypothetical protein FACS1894217_09010 [Clostridia bacterium]|nr:hypothetical protein FACS1894217_09010 [Clostridia bacterium]